MKTTRKGPSTLVRALFKVPVWMYQARLGFLFFGSLIAIVHRGARVGAATSQGSSSSTAAMASCSCSHCGHQIGLVSQH